MMRQNRAALLIHLYAFNLPISIHSHIISNLLFMTEQFLRGSGLKWYLLPAAPISNVSGDVVAPSAAE